MIYSYFLSHPNTNEKDWISSEMLRHTMTNRQDYGGYIFLIFLASVIQTAANAYQTLAWLLVSFASLASVNLIKKQFHTKYASSPVEEQLAFEKNIALFGVSMLSHGAWQGGLFLVTFLNTFDI